jgi:hypothetical protein
VNTYITISRTLETGCGEQHELGMWLSQRLIFPEMKIAEKVLDFIGQNLYNNFLK